MTEYCNLIGAQDSYAVHKPAISLPLQSGSGNEARLENEINIVSSGNHTPQQSQFCPNESHCHPGQDGYSKSLASYLAVPRVRFLSLENRRGKSGSKRHAYDDARRNVTNLTSRISLAPMNFVPRHQSLVQTLTAPNSRTALSKAFTDTPTAIYRTKGTYMYV